MAQEVVIYTPQENFWYNGPGAILIVWAFGVILALLVGYAAGAMWPNRDLLIKRFVGALAGLAVGALYYWAILC